MASRIRFFFDSPTVAEVLSKFDGVGPGFNFWRFLLSSLVIYLHSYFVCYGVARSADVLGPFWSAPIFRGLLPIFFSLSGFLVARSALRTRSLPVFLTFRVLRLVPALAVETTLAALILGPIMTTWPPVAYFTDKRFFAYFGNIIGRVRYELPGVFTSNPVPNTVNMNLWTLHAELTCYVLMALAIFFGLIYRRRTLSLVWLFVTIAMAIWNIRFRTFEPNSLYPISIFTYSFCCGVVAFLWRDIIPVNGWFFFSAVAAHTIAVKLPQTVFIDIPFLTYIMIYIGLCPRLNFGWLARGDYSYGMYIYSFVIQQTLSETFPIIREWWLMFPVSWTLSLVFAAVSWHFIERPALSLKRYAASFKPSGV